MNIKKTIDLEVSSGYINVSHEMGSDDLFIREKGKDGGRDNTLLLEISSLKDLADALLKLDALIEEEKELKYK